MASELILNEDDEATGCSWIIFSGRNDPPEPPEYCEDDALPGEEFCAAHIPFSD